MAVLTRLYQFLPISSTLRFCLSKARISLIFFFHPVTVRFFIAYLFSPLFFSFLFKQIYLLFSFGFLFLVFILLSAIFFYPNHFLHKFTYLCYAHCISFIYPGLVFFFIFFLSFYLNVSCLRFSFHLTFIVTFFSNLSFYLYFSFYIKLSFCF